MAFGFISCNNNEVEVEKKYSDEEILASVRFVGQGGLDNSSEMLRSIPPDEILVFTMDLGRKSLDCKGFGICKVQIGPWVIWNEIPYDDSNVIYLPYDGMTDLSDIKLLLAEQPGIDMRHVLFPVDEDIEVTIETNGVIEQLGTVSAQKAVFQEKLGEFGGFELEIVSTLK